MSIRDRLQTGKLELNNEDENLELNVNNFIREDGSDKYNSFIEILNDKNIDKIFINENSVFIEKKGREYKTGLSFSSPLELENIITKIAENSSIDNNLKNGILNFKLNDGSHVFSVFPPYAAEYPILYIKKVKDISGTIESLIGLGSISKEIGLFLEAVSNLDLNILIVGAQNSGKTTLLGAMAKKIQNNKRILTIERTPELKLNQNQVIRLYSNDRSDFGDLIYQGLEFNPNKLILGDCDKNAIEGLLEACFRGKSFITTLNSNSILNAIKNLQGMFELNKNQELSSYAKNLILNNIDLIIELKRFDNGAIRVSQIVEPAYENNILSINKIFYWDYKNGIDGCFYSNDVKPKFFENTGFEICDLIFEKNYEHTNNIIKEDKNDGEDIENQIKKLYSHSRSSNIFKKFKRK